MAYFHLKLVPPRPGFPHDASPEEMAAMEAHGAYWQGHAESGIAIAVGPVFADDGAFGIAVVEASDPAGAQDLCDSDPVIRAGLGFQFVISPMPSLIIGKAVAGVVPAA